MSFTGAEIAALRTHLGLDRTQFAMLMGTHYTTTYRWEENYRRKVKADPFHEAIVAHIEARIDASTVEEVLVLSQRVQAALAHKGTLSGLAVVLEDLLVAHG